ncbi:MAG TPA: AraC family transcriptional regulator [Rhizomicrobium sp.]
MQKGLGKIHDVREELGHAPSAIASLTVLPAGRVVPDHVHANPYLALHVLGSYRDCGDRGEAPVNGPAALYFPAGSTHGMAIGKAGLATIIIEFELEALHRAIAGLDELTRPRFWLGGEIGHQARCLGQSWLAGTPSPQRFAQTTSLLKIALQSAPQPAAPRWLDELETFVDAEYRSPDAERWAEKIGVTRPWLTRAYRGWRGEGLCEALRRRRVEAAVILLESSDKPLAEIAAAAGFCDQSHMNRAFKKHLGRTPAVTRAAHLGLVKESK